MKFNFTPFLGNAARLGACQYPNCDSKATISSQKISTLPKDNQSSNKNTENDQRRLPLMSVTPSLQLCDSYILSKIWGLFCQE